MIEAISFVFIVIFIDRVFPARTYLADLRPGRPSLEEVYKRYGLVKFPRTVLALLLMAAGVSKFAFKIEGELINFVVMGTAICYLAAVWYDDHKAMKIK